MPSGDVATLPPTPPTRNCEPVHTAEWTIEAVPHAVALNPDLYVQVMPSGDVATWLSVPTTRNCEPVHTTDLADAVPHVVALNPA